MLLCPLCDILMKVRVRVMFRVFVRVVLGLGRWQGLEITCLLAVEFFFDGVV
jgi:hypothetical protein